jgi:hypothetical protein
MVGDLRSQAPITHDEWLSASLWWTPIFGAVRGMFSSARARTLHNNGHRHVRMPGTTPHRGCSTVMKPRSSLAYFLLTLLVGTPFVDGSIPFEVASPVSSALYMKASGLAFMTRLRPHFSMQ